MQIGHHHHVASAAGLGSVPALSHEESVEIRRTLGATPIYILRQSYGAGFAPGTPGDVTLGQAMDHIDNSSMSLLARRLAHRAADELNRM
jgi:hypothetical protein